MAAPIRNNYWEFRNKHGRNFKYTPKALWEEALGYFEFMSLRVWNKKEAIKSGELAGKLIDIPTTTPLSIETFCLYADITRQTFLNYESNEEPYKDFFEVVTRVRAIIESNQFEGASVGAYNASIMASKLGLANKQLHGSDPDNPLPPASIPLVLTNGKTYDDLKDELKPE